MHAHMVLTTMFSRFSLDQRQAQWRKLILAAHPDSYKHHQYNLADHQRGTCTLRGIRRRLVLKVEGFARVSKHAEKTTTSSDRGVDGRYMG